MCWTGCRPGQQQDYKQLICCCDPSHERPSLETLVLADYSLSLLYLSMHTLWDWDDRY